MVICVCAFTPAGKELEKKLETQFSEIIWIKKQDSEDIKNWISGAFSKRLPLLFIGAAGIAVRLISDFVKDKLEDSPVIVMDEGGRFVIPVLSGHVGGANEIAGMLAEGTGATAVITTATDVEKLFSVDVFAVKNRFKIINRDGIKKVSAKLINREEVTVFVSPEIIIEDNNIPSGLKLLSQKSKPEYADIWIQDSENDIESRDCLLLLEAKNYCAGIGCKKDKSFEEIKSFLESELTTEQINGLCSIASIDLKKKEPGLQILSQFYNVPFNTYTAQELELVEGDFSESDFVKQTAGVGNVCERAAVLSGGEGAELIVKKQALNGITLALAKRKPRITTWRTK